MGESEKSFLAHFLLGLLVSFFSLGFLPRIATVPCVYKTGEPTRQPAARERNLIKFTRSVEQLTVRIESVLKTTCRPLRSAPSIPLNDDDAGKIRL